MSSEKSERIMNKYLTLLKDTAASSWDNWENLDKGTQNALIDTMYNVGPGATRWKGLSSSIANGEAPKEIMKNILDSANVGGKSVKGLAKRRAMSYNMAVSDEDKITKVTQLKDGTIQYFSNEGLVFQYKRDRHSDSKPGSITVK